MSKLVMYGTYSHENDTKLVYTNDGKQSELILEYTDEDPDYGTEMLVRSGDVKNSMVDLVRKQLAEITEFLDDSYGGVWRPGDVMEKHPDDFDDLNNSTFIAFEHLLQDIMMGTPGKRNFGKNMNGHEYVVTEIKNAACYIEHKFLEKDVKSVYIATDIDDATDFRNPEEVVCWHKIIKLELPFDNNDDEIALLMGYCGGGNVAMAYSYDDCDRCMFYKTIEKMICDSTGEDPDTKVYVEFIGVNDKHSYENDDHNKEE